MTKHKYSDWVTQIPDGYREGEQKRHWPYFFLNVPCREEPARFPLLLARDVTQGETPASFSPHKCVAGKVEQSVKQHLHHGIMKFSSKNNANELPWNNLLFFFLFFFQAWETIRVKLPITSAASETFQNSIKPHQTEIIPSLSPPPPPTPGPSLHKVCSGSPSRSSQIVSGPGHRCSVASLHSEHKRLLCANIKGGLSNLGLALCW